MCITTLIFKNSAILNFDLVFLKLCNTGLIKFCYSEIISLVPWTSLKQDFNCLFSFTFVMTFRRLQLPPRTDLWQGIWGTCPESQNTYVLI